MNLNERLFMLLKDKRSFSYMVALAILLSAFILLLSLNQTALSLTTANTSKANLTIWDTTDSTTMYTYPTCRDEHPNLDYQCPSKGLSSYNIYFYANFTNKSSGAIIESTREDGNCSIRFNENLTGVFTGWWNMTYSSSTGQYQYNRSLKYKGNIPFEINCTNSTYGSVNASENAFISNTNPSIFAKNPGGKLPTRSITEDIVFYYNFSENCTDDDQNDIPSLTFNYIAGNTTLANFSFNTATGNLTVNISTNNDVGDSVDKIAFTCSDSGGIEDKAEMNFTISAVNDAPLFINLNSTMNATENVEFNFTILASDEENNTPFYFNATFMNCSTMNWSSRNSTKCSLFNLTGWRNDTAITINFTPTNNDIGNYSIEFNVTDAGNTITPYNATRIKTVVFTVINTNDPPAITYACNRERNATEDANFACWITANDTDESNNLTFSSNATWFTFNNSRNIFSANISGNSTAGINFTANDSAVGVWYINITVNDTAGGMNSTAISFNVSNVNDSVRLSSINNSFEAYMLAEFYLEINASDDDLRIPRQGRNCSSGCFNESLAFERNISNLTFGIEEVNRSLFRIIKNTSAGTGGVIGNTSFAYIKFTPSQSDAGNYTINITVRDANNNSIHSKLFNITVFANTAPYWVNLTATSFTFNEGTFNLNLSQNATDDDADAITFTDNTGLFAISSTGSISIAASTANDSNVGNYETIITLTDARGAVNSSQSFTFRVKNANETPILYTIANQSVNEDSALSLTMYAEDEDLSLNTSATDFYSENLVWSVNSTTSWFNGVNATIKLNFTRTDNRTATISFTPNKTDVGAHTINITVNDSTGRMDSQELTITVSEINHQPYFTYTGSPLNITLNASNNYTCINCIDINVSDDESGNDSIANTNFSFTSNETWFKISNATAKVNFTAKQSYVKANGWWINVTVYDGGVSGSGNKTNSTLFRLFIFEYNVKPTVERVAPSPTDSQANMAENSSKLFTVIISDENADAPNSDTLNITWKIDGVENTSTRATVSNGSTNSYTYAANFTGETTNSTAKNISIWVYDSQNNLTIMSWNVSVNHTNAPPQFTGSISNITMSGTSSVNVSCDFSSSTGMCEYSGTSTSAGGYFSDVDHSDTKYNHSINLALGIMDGDCSATKSNSTISVNMNNNTLAVSFYTTSTAAQCFNITAIDSNESYYNVTSNKFRVNLTVNEPTTTPTPSPSSGGGGGGGSTRKTPIALKIIVPEPMSMYTKDRIIVPISVLNNGSIDLYEISLTISTLPPGLKVSLSKEHLEKLLASQKESIEMTITTNSNATASYEIILTGTSKTPSYTDSASFFLNLIELGWKERIKAQEKIIFLQELLLGNPECLELQEVLNEAKKEFESQNYQKSLQLAETAIQACKYAIASKGKTVEIKKRFKVQDYVLPALEGLFVFLLLYFIYHYMQRRMMKKRR